jgi:hypothetical protein
MTDKERAAWEALEMYFKPTRAQSPTEELEDALKNFIAAHKAIVDLLADSDPKPTIDRSLRGWVLVTDEDGDQQVRWADDEGISVLLSDGVGGGLFTNWGVVYEKGWTVEQLPTGYTIADIETVLNEIFDEEWARNKNDEMLWPGIAHVVTRLRRLKENV